MRLRVEKTETFRQEFTRQEAEIKLKELQALELTHEEEPALSAERDKLAELLTKKRRKPGPAKGAKGSTKANGTAASAKPPKESKAPAPQPAGV